MIKNMFLAFIPLFVAVDAIGVLPIFVSLTEKMKAKERLNVIRWSIVTATCVAIFFIFLGKAVFNALNITIADFMVAGGMLLLYCDYRSFESRKKDVSLMVNWDLCRWALH